jgi:histidyl-tRNA synthetase
MTTTLGHDAPPHEAAKWRFVRRRAYAAFLGHGYREAQPSPLEPAGQAARAGGGDAFAVGDGAELRRDGVVSLARAFAHLAPADEAFARWMTAGNVYDPTPAGPLRWRAFHAVSGIIVGASEPAAEAEVAGLLVTLARDLELRDAEVVLGSVGDDDAAARFLAACAELLPLRCAACRALNESDPLRFLGCDDEGCRALTASAPPYRQFVSVDALKHHEAVLATLEASGIVVRDEPRLAFGAGRYNQTVLELRARPDAIAIPGSSARPVRDGAAGAELPSSIIVARGGRRDGLLPLFGRDLPLVGVTIGVARMSACVPGEGESYESSCEVLFAARGAAARAFALKAAAVERARGFRVDVDLREVGWADQLRRAEQVRARVVVVVGDVERKKGEVALRDMTTREVRHIPEERLSFEIKRLLR